jgi:pimeloyl-ACP methyl ester carboxylesterase
MRLAAQNALIPWALKGPLEFRAVMDDATPASAYRALNFPVLILGGERTLMPTRLIAEGLVDLLPTSRLMVIDEAGHMGRLTHTAQVCALIMCHIVDADERCGHDTSAAEILDAPNQIRVCS